MRPAANDSLYKILIGPEGMYEFNLPEGYAIRPLTTHDLEQVLALEKKNNGENECALNEKQVEDILNLCPELCAGIFKREFNWDGAESLRSESGDAQNIVVSNGCNVKSERLCSHIIATKTDSEVIDEESLKVGSHREDGRTIALHSVLVDPEFRGRRFGYIMMKDYVQKFFSLCTAERITVRAPAGLIKFFEKHGFKDIGASTLKDGAKDMHNFTLPFDTYDEEAELYLE